jgi:hypothetical protein
VDGAKEVMEEPLVMSTSAQMAETVRIQGIVDSLDETWAADQEIRANPEIATQQFHTSVPVLKYLGWRLTATARGSAESILPLNVTSTNQHITHQAAVILIAADYTGGVALATLLHGVPFVGIQPHPTEYAANLWGAKADITWIKPSVADLVCRAAIPKITCAHRETVFLRTPSSRNCSH